jgi:ribosomal protein S18 acetylase RimI-like enzyme
MRKQASFDVRVLPAAEWPRLADFLFERNVNEGLLCLHSDAGAAPDAYAEDLAALAPHEACFVAEEANGRVVAALGAQFDVDLGRGWLRGPFLAPAVAAGRQADPLRAALLERLMQAVPEHIHQLDALIAATHPETVDFYLHAGFQQLASQFIYAAARPARVARPAPPDGFGIETCRPEWLPALIELHDAEFPRPHPFVSQQELEAPANGTRTTLAAVREGRAVGYVHASYNADVNEGYLDLIAVWPYARGNGIGRALLDAANHWAFAEHGADAIGLTLREEKARARTLFERAGYILQAEGVHLCLRRAGFASVALA